MHFLGFNEAERYLIAWLIEGAAFNRPGLEQGCLDVLRQQGLPSDQVIGFTLVEDLSHPDLLEEHRRVALGLFGWLRLAYKS